MGPNRFRQAEKIMHMAVEHAVRLQFSNRQTIHEHNNPTLTRALIFCQAFFLYFRISCTGPRYFSPLRLKPGESSVSCRVMARAAKTKATFIPPMLLLRT